jgi:hypothetical protein
VWVWMREMRGTRRIQAYASLFRMEMNMFIRRKATCVLDLSDIALFESDAETWGRSVALTCEWLTQSREGGTGYLSMRQGSAFLQLWSCFLLAVGSFLFWRAGGSFPFFGWCSFHLDGGSFLLDAALSLLTSLFRP